VTNAAAASQLAHLGISPGSGASHQQPQHEPHEPPQQAGSNSSHSVTDAAAASQLAYLGLSPGSGASHQQPQHEPKGASHEAVSNNPHSVPNAVAISELVQPEVPLGNGPSHQSAAASVSQPLTANFPNHESSFYFNTEVIVSNTDEVMLMEIGSAVPSADGHGAGYVGPAEVPSAVFSPADEYAIHANFHALSHGPHALLV
jgi:hypothetical protein